MPKMKIAGVPTPGVDFEIPERGHTSGHIRSFPDTGLRPGPRQGSTMRHLLRRTHVRDGLVPFIAYPRSPCHEVPLDMVNESYNRMNGGKTQYRVVLTM